MTLQTGNADYKRTLGAGPPSLSPLHRNTASVPVLARPSPTTKPCSQQPLLQDTWCIDSVINTMD